MIIVKLKSQITFLHRAISTIIMLAIGHKSICWKSHTRCSWCSVGCLNRTNWAWSMDTALPWLSIVLQNLYRIIRFLYRSLWEYWSIWTLDGILALNYSSFWKPEYPGYGFCMNWSRKYFWVSDLIWPMISGGIQKHQTSKAPSMIIHLYLKPFQLG